MSLPRTLKNIIKNNFSIATKTSKYYGWYMDSIWRDIIRLKIFFLTDYDILLEFYTTHWHDVNHQLVTINNYFIIDKYFYKLKIEIKK